MKNNWLTILLLGLLIASLLWGRGQVTNISEAHERDREAWRDSLGKLNAAFLVKSSEVDSLLKKADKSGERGKGKKHTSDAKTRIDTVAGNDVDSIIRAAFGH